MNAKMNNKSTGTKGFSIGQWLIKYNTVVIFVLLIVVSSMLSEAFITKQNIFNVLRQQAPYISVGLGMLIVLISGGIDLSAGSMAGVASMITAMGLTQLGIHGLGGLVVAVILALLVGAATGILMGSLISFLKLAPFILTLAFLTIGRGAAYMLTSGAPVRLDRDLDSNMILINFGSNVDPIIGVPWPVWLVTIAVIVLYLIMKYTRFGRLLIAIGSNEEAVRLSGINVNKYKIAAYMICSLFASIAGIIVASRTASATPTTGTGLELDAIAGCVIGGASLNGGKGSIIMTVIGVLTLGLIGNIMNLLSIAAYPQQVIKGVIIVIAVIMQKIQMRDKQKKEVVA